MALASAAEQRFAQELPIAGAVLVIEGGSTEHVIALWPVYSRSRARARVPL